MVESLQAAPGQPAAPEASQRPVFRIAVTMSGAISAGAYTAGVFDFLMQALTEWELAKARPDPAAVTDHDVRIVAMTGASAGGITAALGTVALGYGMTFEPTEPDAAARRLVLHRMTQGNGQPPIECVLPRLYQAWVTGPRMFAVNKDDPALLSVEDIKDGKVCSLLNWRVLNDIRDAALAQPSEFGQGVPYAFFADPLHVYLTISNLRGVPYDVKGAKDSAPYHMLSHGDRLHFKVGRIGTDPGVASDWAGRDQGIPMSAAALCQPGGPSNEWQILGDAALATAAFPGGLSARLLKATRADFKDRWFPAPKFDGTDIKPAWPDGFAVPPAGEFDFVNVDGGVINNDPFDYARYALLDGWEDFQACNPRGPGQAKQAVIMISPFPEGATFDTEDRSDIGLLSVAKALLPTLITQARFKLTELAAAADPNIASRWLIAPRRSNDEGAPPSSANIACGLLGGFGGFLDQSFREHDFQLGRRNCQKFLRDWTESAFTASTNTPIIPLLGSADQQVPPSDWPRMSMDNFNTLMTRIEMRANAVVPALIKQELPNPLFGWIARRAWSGVPLWNGARGMFLDTVRCSILADLIQRDQIEDGLPDANPADPRLLRNFSENQRKVIAAMADPRYDLRTVPGICASTKLPKDAVEQAIDKAMRLEGNAVHRAWQSPILTTDGHPTYTLYSRRLGAKTWPVIGAVLRKVSHVGIDWPPPAA